MMLTHCGNNVRNRYSGCVFSVKDIVPVPLKTSRNPIIKKIRPQTWGVHIDLGTIREMYLDREWSQANPEEAQMAFLLACHLAREFVAHNSKDPRGKPRGI